MRCDGGAVRGQSRQMRSERCAMRCDSRRRAGEGRSSQVRCDGSQMRRERSEVRGNFG
jgi:hypothetical protein